MDQCRAWFTKVQILIITHFLVFSGQLKKWFLDWVHNLSSKDLTCQLDFLKKAKTTKTYCKCCNKLSLVFFGSILANGP